MTAMGTLMLTISSYLQDNVEKYPLPAIKEGGINIFLSDLSNLSEVFFLDGLVDNKSKLVKAWHQRGSNLFPDSMFTQI